MLRRLYYCLIPGVLAIAGCGGGVGGPSNLNPAQPQNEYLYAADATQAYTFSVDLSSGSLTPIKVPPIKAGTSTEWNSFTAPSVAKIIYDLTPLNDAVNAFSVESDGTLSPVAGSPFSPPSIGTQQNLGPIAITPSGSTLIALNRGEGINVFQANPATGTLTAKPLVRTNAFIDDNADLVIDPSGKFVYITTFVANDFDQQDHAGILGYSIDPATGNLIPLPNSPYQLPANSQPEAITMDPSGRFVYTSLFNNNVIAGFVRDPNTGDLTPISGSPFQTTSAVNPEPTALAMHPSGKFLYAFVMEGSQIVGYNIDPNSGALTQVQGSPFAPQKDPETGDITTSGPMRADPSGKFLYVVCSTDFLAAYDINQSTGALERSSGSPYPAPIFIGDILVTQAP